MTASDDLSVPNDNPAASGRCQQGICLSVSNEQSHVAVNVDLLNEITTALLDTEGFPQAELSVALVDDAVIHDVNRKYLNHDYPTDVISFLLSDPPEDGDEAPAIRMEGEIVISGETAMRVANEVGCPAHEELTLYLVHGLLHLCGYDDQTPADQETMRSRERMHLQKFGIKPHY